MPIVSTVQVTSFVQFDGDQSTAVHTRTVVEISEDGDVLIEDSTEIDNALSAVCVRQSAQVDTESSQMLLHSETQQDKPEFDPKAPPNDVIVEQKSDLVEDDDDTKEAQTNVTIGPNNSAGSRGTDPSTSSVTEPGDKRRSLTDESSLTQVSDLERSFDKLSVDTGEGKSDSVNDRTAREKSKLDFDAGDTGDAGTRKRPQSKDNVEFEISDVEGIDYDPKTPKGHDDSKKEIKDHAVDMIPVTLPKVLDLLASIRKGPTETPKISSEGKANPLDENEPEAAIAQLPPSNAPADESNFESSSPMAVDPLEESLSPDSIRRKSLTQLGARPKRSALDLLPGDTPTKSSPREQQIGTESLSAAKIRSSPAEVRKVSFNTKPSPKESPKATRVARDETRSRMAAARSNSEEDRSEDLTENIFKTADEQTSKRAVVRNLRKQFRPSLGVRAKIRRPSARQLPEDELKTNPRISKTIKPKKITVETEASPSSSRKALDKDILRKYSSND